MPIAPKTMFEKIWDGHVVAALPGDISLLHIDRHYLHELTGVEAINVLYRRSPPIKAARNPELTFATLDHVISTVPGRTEGDAAWASDMVNALRQQTQDLNIPCFDIDDRRQGIVHVNGPELGLSLPGSTIVCGDSHTCTHGAFGAMAWGIGLTEQSQVLATQTLRQKRPPVMRINLQGRAGADATAKDIILYIIGQLGVAGASGYAVEFAGDAVRAMSMEERMTLCNPSIELGARFGMVAPDETTFDYLRECDFAPKGEMFDRALAYWQSLPSDADAVFDQERYLDITGIGPHMTWGTSPEQVIDLSSPEPHIPDPKNESDPAKRTSSENALRYMHLEAGQALLGTRIDRVFIGSCTNSRISDLRAAAALVKGQRVAAHVNAWVVPGSMRVADQAQREGLDRIFIDAGFEWRAPGCSMCVGANGDLVGRGERCVSTSNRNFVGRQGPESMTHLASPVTAAISALRGVIAVPSEAVAPLAEAF